MSFAPASTFAVSGYVWIIACVGFSYALYEQIKMKRDRPTAIVGLLLVSTILRAAWFLNNFGDNTDGLLMSACSRMSISLQVSGVSLLVLVWARSTIITDEMQLQVTRICIAINILVYLFVFVLGLAFYESLYTINLFALSIVSIGLALFVSSFAESLRIHLCEDNSPYIRSVISKLAITGSVITVFFFLRGLCFAYHPLTGNNHTPSKIINQIIYPWFFYHFPELIPNVVIVFAISPKDSIFRLFAKKFSSAIDPTSSFTRNNSMPNPIFTADQGLPPLYLMSWSQRGRCLSKAVTINNNSRASSMELSRSHSSGATSYGGLLVDVEDI